MEKRWPAVDVAEGDAELIVAAIDECSPSAVEEFGAGVRIFFSRPVDRDAALLVLGRAGLRATATEISDENWAERSQVDLGPVAVGNFTIFPSPPPASLGRWELVIPASTAFGTGHHATTRLCLAALQRLDLGRRHVLDVGTGSGLLALAAARLGAARVLGIDHDPDAIRTARHNLALNGGDARVQLEARDIRDAGAAAAAAAALPYDVVVANLTAALLVAAAPALRDACRPGGHLVLSGLLTGEEDGVARAFGAVTRIWHDSEHEWAVLVFSRPQMA